MLAFLAAASLPALLVQPSMPLRSAPVVRWHAAQMMATQQPKAWAQPAIAAILAAAISFSDIDAAHAKSSGGRVGGRVSSSSSMSVKPTAPKPAGSSATKPTAGPSTTTAAAPAAVAPAAAPQVTNVYMSQPMGYGYGGYGMGMSNSGMGLLVGVELANAFLKEQQRQAYLQQQLKVQQQLGADSAQIAELQRQLAAQNAKVEGLAAQKAAEQGAPTPAQPVFPAQMASEEQLKLQLAVLQQQKELEALKAAK